MTRPTGPSGPTIAGELEESADPTVSAGDSAETESSGLLDFNEPEGARGVEDAEGAGEPGKAWESKVSPPDAAERGESDC